MSDTNGDGHGFLKVRDLMLLYPGVFGAAVRPLKVGIFNDLLAAHEGCVKRHTIHALLASHTSQAVYLVAIINGGARYALDGSIAGEVTDAERASAKERLGQIRRDNSHLAKKDRSATLKAFEASHLSKKEFAEQNGLTEAELSSVLSKGRIERRRRQKKRLQLVERFEKSQLSLEEFSAQSKVSVGGLRSAIQSAKWHAYANPPRQ